MGSDGGGGGAGRGSQDCPDFDNVWGQSEQSCVQETSTVRYCWMSLVPHGVPYRALCIAAVQGVVFVGKHPLFTTKLRSQTFPFFLVFKPVSFNSEESVFFFFCFLLLLLLKISYYACTPSFFCFLGFFCSFVFVFLFFGQDLISRKKNNVRR